MKITSILAVFLVCAGMGASVVLASVEDQIKARVEPVGTVCVQGEDCGDVKVSAASASGEPRSGEKVYGAVCKACHAAGVAGAPKLGDKEVWAPRISEGMETLVSHAVDGYNAMPAKGGCANCPDEEIEAAVKYMVEAAK